MKLPHPIRTRIGFAWPWAPINGRDTLGLAFLGAVFVAFVSYTLWHWSSFGRCSGQILSVELKLAASDAEIRDATSGSFADRCRAYRNRTVLLLEGHDSKCVPSGGRDGVTPSSYDTQLRFFNRLIAEHCS